MELVRVYVMEHVLVDAQDVLERPPPLKKDQEVPLLE
jgi:hypothetical protein